MTVTRLGSVAALVGGLLWVVAAVLGWGDDTVNQALSLGGLALLVVAFAALGYALVTTAPVWLRAVVTVATPVLGAMVWVIVADSVSTEYVAVLAGGLLLLVGGGVALPRGRRTTVERPGPPPRAPGHRAAR
jgi:hypothetical protein